MTNGGVNFPGLFHAWGHQVIGGAVETGDGSLNVYYAGADKYMCLATAKTQDPIDLCLEK